MADMQEVMDKDDSTFIEHISMDPNVSVTSDLGDINTGPARPILQVSFQFLLKKIVKLTGLLQSHFLSLFLHSHENSQLLSLFCVTIYILLHNIYIYIHNIYLRYVLFLSRYSN